MANRISGLIMLISKHKSPDAYSRDLNVIIRFSDILGSLVPSKVEITDVRMVQPEYTISPSLIVHASDDDPIEAFENDGDDLNVLVHKLVPKSIVGKSELDFLREEALDDTDALLLSGMSLSLYLILIVMQSPSPEASDSAFWRAPTYTIRRLEGSFIPESPWTPRYIHCPWVPQESIWPPVVESNTHLAVCCLTKLVYEMKFTEPRLSPFDFGTSMPTHEQLCDVRRSPIPADMIMPNASRIRRLLSYETRRTYSNDIWESLENVAL